MCHDQRWFVTHDGGQDLLYVKSKHPRGRIAKAFAAWRRVLIAPTPPLNVGCSPTSSRLILVEPCQLPIVSLVQGRVGRHRYVTRPQIGQNDLGGSFGAFQHRTKSSAKAKAKTAEAVGDRVRLRDACLRKSRIMPTCKSIFGVVCALSVPDEHKIAFHDELILVSKVGLMRGTGRDTALLGVALTVGRSVR